MRIAIIGSGISGLSAAWALSISGNDVIVYEKDSRVGGHTNTIDIDKVGPVDTGFIVFNQQTYPNLINFFKHLGVKYIDSDMTFSVSADQGAFEWAGEGLHTVFAQKSNLFSPSFYRMMADILRFNSEAPKLLLEKDETKLSISLGDYLDQNGYSQIFREGYLLPMTGAIWSTPVAEMLKFPAVTLIRFCHNHSLLQLVNRPKWLTVNQGSREYVKKIQEIVRDIRTSTPVSSVRRNSDGTVLVQDSTGKEEIFDHVVFACHGDQTLKLLADPSPAESRILGRIVYRPNSAVVHRDKDFMPVRKVTWSSWNYQTSSKSKFKEQYVSLTYWMNKLQPFIPKNDNIFVTLNPLTPPKKELTIAEFQYEHPAYTTDTIKSQKELPEIQGKRNTWFAGAWTNYGFHEDGLTSGLRVAQSLGAKIPFPVADATHIRPLTNSKL